MSHAVNKSCESHISDYYYYNSRRSAWAHLGRQQGVPPVLLQAGYQLVARGRHVAAEVAVENDPVAAAVDPDSLRKVSLRHPPQVSVALVEQAAEALLADETGETPVSGEWLGEGNTDQ